MGDEIKTYVQVCVECECEYFTNEYVDDGYCSMKCWGEV